jgi:class 3 adenylate cyclase
LRREVVDPTIAEHIGRIVKTTGDGMLVDFPSAVDAVTCAMAVQSKMPERKRIVSASMWAASLSTAMTSLATASM